MQNHISLWKHVDCSEYHGTDDADEELQDDFGGYENWGLQSFLENWDLSDVIIIVGAEERAVPAHKVILAASGNFGLNFSGENCIHLQDVSYPILHALLEYIYTGHTCIQESHLNSLKSLSSQFEVVGLARQCDEMIERFKFNKKLFDSGRSIEISYPSSRLNCGTVFLNKSPIDVKRLNNFRLASEYTDVDICIEAHGKVARSHRIILGLWSVPFTKMFTNGMTESISSEVHLKDVYLKLKIMFEFMYTGVVYMEDTMEIDMLLLQLLLLADQFGVSLLHQECCKKLLEHMSEAWSTRIARRPYNDFFYYTKLMDEEEDNLERYSGFHLGGLTSILCCRTQCAKFCK